MSNDIPEKGEKRNVGKKIRTRWHVIGGIADRDQITTSGATDFEFWKARRLRVSLNVATSTRFSRCVGFKRTPGLFFSSSKSPLGYVNMYLGGWWPRRCALRSPRCTKGWESPRQMQCWRGRCSERGAATMMQLFARFLVACVGVAISI